MPAKDLDTIFLKIFYFFWSMAGSQALLKKSFSVGNLLSLYHKIALKIFDFFSLLKG